MPGPLVRPAREEDLDRLIEIHSCAFPDARGHEARRRNFGQNALGSFADLRVVELLGDVVGHGFLLPLATFVGGARVEVGGIASIGVAPEARGRGVATALLASMHDELAARGVPLALLYPFRERFYARLGYASTAPFAALTVDARALAEASGGMGAERRVAIDAGRFDETRALYERAARRATGWLERPESLFARRFADERLHFAGVADERGALAGYVAFSYEMPETHGRTTLQVRELVATDANARRALLALLGAQAAQVDDVALTLAIDDPWLGAFLDAPGPRRGSAALEHPLGTLASGPMVRLIDARRALAARGFAADGELSLAIVEERATERLRLHVRDGRAEVAEHGGGEVDLEVRRDTLASILAGGMRPSEAIALGHARGSVRGAAHAEAMFAGPRFRCLDPF